MKLLLWLSPLFSPLSSASSPAEALQLEELDLMPRSERFPGYPRQSDMPVDQVALAERDRMMHHYLCM